MGDYPEVTKALRYALSHPARRDAHVDWAQTVSGNIADDPMKLLEAMAKDNIIANHTHWSEPGVHFTAIRKHEHEWWVTTESNNRSEVVLRCACNLKWVVPNQLPIEVPKDVGT